uniref:AAA_9 domain-containing protein n=1 Tax=Mesocestoides corti TaxID=53468 RepID=A0A5K3F252_MESCO
ELGLSIPAKQASSKAVPFDFKRFLVTEKEQLQWRSQGLPSDQLSVENAAVILQSSLFPFIVGPSGGTIRWLKNQLKNQQIEVTDQRVLGQQ